MKIALTFATFLICIGVVNEPQAQTEKPIASITAWGMHYGGKVQYTYQLKNLSRGQITRLTLGVGPEDGKESRELTVRPEQDRGTYSFLIPVRSAARPDGWEVLYSYEEENPKFAIDWIEKAYSKELFPGDPENAKFTVPATGPKGIPPGTTESNFSVFLAAMDPAYVNAHAWIDSGDESQIIRVTKGDTSPPSLDIIAEPTAHPGNHNGWVEFALRAVSRDNYDPNPEVTLDGVSGSTDSMTVDRRDGRWIVKFKNTPGKSYRLRFQSVDASGNQTVRNFDYVAQKNPR